MAGSFMSSAVMVIISVLSFITSSPASATKEERNGFSIYIAVAFTISLVAAFL